MDTHEKCLIVIDTHKCFRGEIRKTPIRFEREKSMLSGHETHFKI